MFIKQGSSQTHQKEHLGVSENDPKGSERQNLGLLSLSNSSWRAATR